MDAGGARVCQPSQTIASAGNAADAIEDAISLYTMALREKIVKLREKIAEIDKLEAALKAIEG